MISDKEDVLKRKIPFTINRFYKIGQVFGEVFVVAYMHFDGTVRQYPDLNNYDQDNRHFITYKIQCTRCGTLKFMKHNNLPLINTCGCAGTASTKNFNWTGKSKKI